MTENMIALQSNVLFFKVTMTTLPPAVCLHFSVMNILLLRICLPFMFSSTGQLLDTTPLCLCAFAVQSKESIYNIFKHIFIYY